MQHNAGNTFQNYHPLWKYEISRTQRWVLNNINAILTFLVKYCLELVIIFLFLIWAHSNGFPIIHSGCPEVMAHDGDCENLDDASREEVRNRLSQIMHFALEGMNSISSSSFKDIMSMMPNLTSLSLAYFTITSVMSIRRIVKSQILSPILSYPSVLSLPVCKSVTVPSRAWILAERPSTVLQLGDLSSCSKILCLNFDSISASSFGIQILNN